MTRYAHIVVTIFLILIIFNYSFPQRGKYRFEHLTTENGLFQNVVYSVLQDSKGFLWIGTQDGLIRYDGYNFKVYKHESGNPNSISNNEIETIYIDKNDNLWIGTLGGGLNKYDGETEEFISYQADDQNKFSISSNLVMAIYEDQEGTLWLGTDGGGLNRFDRSNNQFTSFKKDSLDSNTISNNKVYAICEDRSGNFWLGTFGGGLNRFDVKTKKFICYKRDPQNPKSLSSDKIHKIYEDNDSIIWIGTHLGGLNKLVSFSEIDDSPEFVHFISRNFLAPNSLGNNTIWSILEDSDGILWIGTQWGLNICDKVNIQKLFRDDPKDPESINYSSIYSLYEDKSKILWIGTTGGGLNKLNKNKLCFTSYIHNPFDKNRLNGAPTNCFYEENDSTIWVGTGSGGINVMNRNSEEFVGYKYDPAQPRGLVTNIVHQIIKDRNGIVWVGTGIGLFKLLTRIDRPGGPIFEKYFNDPGDASSLSHNSINSICEDKFGALWFGTSDGISILTSEEQNKSDPKFLIYRNDPDNLESISDNYINQIFEDKFGEIWIATNRGGINKYKRDTDSFIRYKHDPNNVKSINSDLILCIYEDNAGKMWFGTGDGICKLNRATHKFNRYSRKDGLAGEIVFGILEDDEKRLWLSTNKGISRFNPTDITFKNFDENDGLLKGGYYRRAYLKTKTGEFLFGGLNGFNLFHPDSIKENTHIPTIVITDFQLNNISVSIGLDSLTNRTILSRSIVETREIELKYDDKKISFEFSALDFHIPKKNRYAYMLEGFDDSWNYTDATRRLVTYTNLDPGDYIFKVKGSNNDGHWNEEGVSLSLIILPPWWATSWAYILYALIILSIIFFTWKLQLKRIRIKHEYEMSKFETEKLHEIDELKSKFFANISHEFRTPLTLILGPIKQIIEQIKDNKTKSELKIVQRNARRLHGMVNQLLDLSKLESGKMKLETSRRNIIPLLKGLVLSFASFTERKRITLNFNSEIEELLVFIDKEKIEKIITNLLSNALKFTPEGGNIDFNVVKRSEEVMLVIKDSGIGIANERLEKIFDRFYQVDGSHTREQEGTGLGLALTKELVELHKGKIEVQSEEGKGSMFIVTLPLGKNHLSPEEIIEKDIIDEKGLVEQPLIEEEIASKEKILETDTAASLNESLLLIVEDNSDVRHYIRTNIEEKYRIIEAINGEDGLKKAIENIPDLIISDVMMPKMDGFEMCTKIRTNEKTSHIPIIMLTAKATSKDKIEGYETGADDYIMKPFNTEELKARIKNLIGMRRKLQEKFSSDDYPPNIQNKKLRKLDEDFMKNVIAVIEKHIAEEEFTIEEFESEFAMSKSQIYRKLKAITGKSPSLYIRSVRLAKAKSMIESQSGNISEIAYSVGFSSPTYFSKCFKEEFGQSPSDFIK